MVVAVQHSWNPIEAELTLSFTGDLLSTNGERCRRLALAAFKNGLAEAQGTIQRLILDLASCHVIDSQGTRLLVDLVTEAQARRASIVVRLGSPSLERLFALPPLDRVELQRVASESKVPL